jgi:hypothetical protein
LAIPTAKFQIPNKVKYQNAKSKMTEQNLKNG